MLYSVWFVVCSGCVPASKGGTGVVHRRLDGHSSIVGVVNAVQETPSSDQIDAVARHYLHEHPRDKRLPSLQRQIGDGQTVETE